jgi:hypothetical protein
MRTTGGRPVETDRRQQKTRIPALLTFASPSIRQERAQNIDAPVIGLLGSQTVIAATFHVAETTRYFNKNVTIAFSTCHGFSFTPGFCLTYP